MKSIFTYSILAVATISLSNCTTTSNIRHDSHRVTARSGERTSVLQNVHLNGDCKFIDYPRVDIVEQPKHGRIEIVHQPVIADSGGKKMKCDKSKRMALLSITYRSQATSAATGSFSGLPKNLAVSKRAWPT
ncbi:hypothetical protein [Rhizobium laguerreae]|uniref:hypothetical protein n=1 Tax=Rhizobium laguerreae TaxID=1076926 RepID=UPI001FEEFBEE|nr:hypothetical protein [Rhizobium laguerreae]